MCKEYLWAGKAPYETDLRPSIEAHCVPGAKSAVVVCPGGGDPQVRLRLVEAVSALTGLGSDRISVCQGDP